MADKLIAVVDDDASVRSATVHLLASVGFACEAFEAVEDYLRSKPTACLILDVSMPGLGGVELRQLLAEQGHKVPIIFITSFPNELWPAGARQLFRAEYGEDLVPGESAEASSLVAG